MRRMLEEIKEQQELIERLQEEGMEYRSQVGGMGDQVKKIEEKLDEKNRQIENDKREMEKISK